MSDSENDDRETDTGRSSPFVDTPSNGIDEHDVSLANLQNNTDPGISLDKGKMNSLEYKLETQKNKFELELLQWQRKYSDLEKKHNTIIKELDLSHIKFQDIKDEEAKLLEEVDSWQKKYKQLDNKLGATVNQLTSDLQEKERFLTERELINSDEMIKLQSDVENYKITIDNLKSSLEKYEGTILDQAKEIVTLSKNNDVKDDEIARLKQRTITFSQHENNTTNQEFTKTSPTDELTTVNRLFQDQIKYTTELEETNLKQAERIKLLEEKSGMQTYWKTEVESLQNKIRELESLEKDYQNSQLELIELKSKIAEWEFYNDQDGDNNNNEGKNVNEDITKKNPTETIRKLKLTKRENDQLVEENTKLTSSNTNLKILNEELAMERSQLLDLNKNYESNIINLKRLNHEYEEQKILISEECKLLRNQLNDYTNSGETDTGKDGKKESIPKENNKQSIQVGLENLVDDYKNKTDDLTNELKKLNQQMLATTEEEQNQNKKKRKLADSSQSNSLTYYSQRINELQLENAKLKRDLGKYQNLNKLLDEKLKRLIMLKEKKIRILQLRDNPLAQDQLVKREQLDLLRQENEDLLKTLHTSVTDIKTVPLSVIKTMEFDLKQGEKELYKSNKRFTRLKEIFNKKSLEFIEVVNSILGFKLEFQQNNKVKIYSCFRPDKYLIVDLINNTLISNLNLDNWDELLTIWIEQKEQIPCFLATITLQLWQNSHE